jgi:hypothetical protein
VSKSCETCHHCVRLDFGYSSYTVEGTEIHCEVKVHPNAPFDRFYGEDKRLAFAEQCARYVEGEPLDMDVDREDYDELSPEDKARWDAFELNCDEVKEAHDL